MRRLLILSVVVGLVLVMAFGTDVLAGKRKRGGDRDRIRDCAHAVCPCLVPCADQQRDQQRDQDRDGEQQQDRDRDRLCDCGQFIDMDGDGFCDNCDCPGMPQDGTGRQYRGGR